MDSFFPKILIVVPLYNASRYYEQCVKSIIDQSYEGHIKIIVVDNESTDISFNEIDQQLVKIRNKMIKKDGNRELYLDKAPNYFKYSWSEPTRQGLKYLDDSCEYFMFIAADDYLDRDFITNYIKILSKKPEKIKLLQSPVKFFGSWKHIQAHSYEGLEDFKKQMLQRSVVNTPTVMWHRMYHDSGLIYLDEPQNYFGADDYALYCELATRGHFIYSAPKWLGYNYRIHEENCSWGMHKELNAPNTIDKEIQERYKKLWEV